MKVPGPLRCQTTSQHPAEDPQFPPKFTRRICRISKIINAEKKHIGKINFHYSLVKRRRGID